MPKILGRGDDGWSGILGGNRLPKSHPRFEALGTVDEAQCAIGMVLSLPVPPKAAKVLTRVQNELFAVGAELASPDRESRPQNGVTSSMIENLEADIRQLESSLPELKSFVVPGGTPAAATCFWARAVVRRAERCVGALLQQGEQTDTALVYLNRLGDLLFLIARSLNPC